ncbi:MAG TPA: hypothetical protein VFX20_12690 [Steroidobacteraceae bacterium]|nr:hypothetical protein [Steroidobacteraceae bacterium]
MLKHNRVRVGIVLSPDNQGWVIEKIAQRLAKHSPAFGAEIVLSDKEDPTADVNHWMSYAFANGRHSTRTSMFITHIDDPYKARLIKQELSTGVDLGICMSNDTRRSLVARGVPAGSLCYILAAHDGLAKPRRIVIGLTTRLYADGRKREDFLVRLGSEVDFRQIKFKIFGSGWEKIIPQLLRHGAEVEYDPGSEDYTEDYGRILSALPTFDYFLYMGMDEGTLGILDALAAGVRTIVTAQGFHLDLMEALTYTFVRYEELRAIFKQILAERERMLNLAAALGWEDYAKRHVEAWLAIKEGRISEFSSSSPFGAPPGAADDDYRNALWVGDWRYRLRALSPIRMRSALSHVPLLKPVRRLLLNRHGMRAHASDKVKG